MPPTPLVSITILTPAMEVHATGCAHVLRALRLGQSTHGDFVHGRSVYTGATAVAAIEAADEDLADWFGEKPYMNDATAWTVTACRAAPCMKPLLRTVRFVGRGRPVAR